MEVSVAVLQVRELVKRDSVNKERSWHLTPRQCFVSGTRAASARKSLSTVQQPSMAPSGLSDSIWALYVGTKGTWLSRYNNTFSALVLTSHKHILYLPVSPITLPWNGLSYAPAITYMLSSTWRVHHNTLLVVNILSRSLFHETLPNPLSQKEFPTLYPPLICSYLKSFHCTWYFPLYIMATCVPPRVKPHSLWVTWREGSSLTQFSLHIVTPSSVPCTEPILNNCSFR